MSYRRLGARMLADDGDDQERLSDACGLKACAGSRGPTRNSAPVGEVDPRPAGALYS
ncbi:hypothetical protein ACWCQQ_41620 [Streptomyces sp. NPDC002143]